MIPDLTTKCYTKVTGHARGDKIKMKKVEETAYLFGK